MKLKEVKLEHTSKSTLQLIHVLVKKYFISSPKSCSCTSFLHGFDKAQRIFFGSIDRTPSKRKQRITIARVQHERRNRRSSPVRSQSGGFQTVPATLSAKVGCRETKGATDETGQHYTNVGVRDPYIFHERGEYSSSIACTVVKRKSFQGQEGSLLLRDTCTFPDCRGLDNESDHD